MEGPGVVLKEPLNLEQLLKGTTFSIDAELNEQSDCDLYDDGDSDDQLDKLNNLDNDAYMNLLTTPGTLNFDELALKMTTSAEFPDVKFLILEEGDGPLVAQDALVTLHYSAFWQGETEPFDCSLEHNDGRPMKKRLGCGNLIAGLEIGLSLVKGPKAKFQLLIGPKLTWGPMGCMVIRPEPALFCITLLDVQNVGCMERFNSLPESDQKKFKINFESATATNEFAKKLFTKRRYNEAVRNYHKSLHILQLCDTQNDEEISIIRKEIKKAYLNIVLCYIKMNNGRKSLRFLDEFARFTDILVECKALYLYGKAFFMTGEYDKSVEFLKKSLKIEPKNPEIGSELAKVEAKIREGDNAYRKMFAGIFTGEEKSDSDMTAKNEFETEMLEFCDGLSKRNGCVEVPLPAGLTDDELDFIKQLCAKYLKLVFVETEKHDGETSYKIVKKY